MAIDFYELGKQSGATTPKGQQSGFQSLVSSATKPIEDMLANSKAATAALTAAMPAGVPIEKVPEELRGQVTNFLTENKKSYTDATKVIASGINPQSDRYKNAVETINKVNTRFENLSGNLENIALERQKYLDDPSYSPNTSRSNATIMSDLANGSLYSRMTINEDGSWNYKDNDGESKAFKDFRIDKQGYLGQQGHLAMVEHLDKNARDINGNVKNWEGNLKNYYNLQINNLFNKLGPKGSQDYVMADDEFLQERYDSKKLKETKGNFEDYKDALTQGSKEDLIEDYKQYNLNLLEKQHGNAVAKNTVNELNLNNKTTVYSPNTSLGGGVSTNTLISYISDLESGTIINPRDGQTYKVNDDNSWVSETGNSFSGNDMINELQYFEYEKQGYTYGEDGQELTKGSKKPYMFVKDIQFKPFLGTSTKQDNETFLPATIDISQVESTINSSASNAIQLVKSINKILDEKTEIDSSEYARQGGTFSRGTINFAGQEYNLKGYFSRNKDRKEEGQKELNKLIEAIKNVISGGLPGSD